MNDWRIDMEISELINVYNDYLKRILELWRSL